MSTIAGSKVQDRQRQLEQRIRAGSALADQIVYGKIIDVFDEEWLDDKRRVAPEISAVIARYPGELIFLIELENKRQIALPSQRSQDELESIYGNKPLLLGRRVKVHYRNRDIASGWFVFQNERTTRRLDMRETSKIADIGGIL